MESYMKILESCIGYFRRLLTYALSLNIFIIIMFAVILFQM